MALVDDIVFMDMTLCLKLIRVHYSSSWMFNVQIWFLRRKVPLISRWMIVSLSTETGIMPLAIRRSVLVPSNLTYLISLDHSHFTRAAMPNSVVCNWGGRQAGSDTLSWLVETCHLLCWAPPRDLSIDYIEEYFNMVRKTWVNGCRMESTARWDCPKPILWGSDENARKTLASEDYLSRKGVVSAGIFGTL